MVVKPQLFYLGSTAVILALGTPSAMQTACLRQVKLLKVLRPITVIFQIHPKSSKSQPLYTLVMTNTAHSY